MKTKWVLSLLSQYKLGRQLSCLGMVLGPIKVSILYRPYSFSPSLTIRVSRFPRNAAHVCSSQVSQMVRRKVPGSKLGLPFGLRKISA